MNEAARKGLMHPEASSYRWLVIPLWIVGHVWGQTVLDNLGFLLPSIRADLGLTSIQEGLLGSAPRIANILLVIPLGWYLSRFRPKLLTSLSLFGMVLLALFQGWAPS